MKNHSREEIATGVTLHTLHEDKFKTNLIKFYFRRPLTQDEVTYNALLPKILQRGTEGFETSKKLSRELEYLYGAYLDGQVIKKGESQIIDFSLGIADLRFVDDQSLLKDSVNLLNELIYKPYRIDGFFKKEYLQQEKANLEKKIKARVNDKNRYAVERCIEEMCENENFRLYEYGKIDDLEGINQENLFRYYQQLITKSPLDIVVVGNIDKEVIKKELLNQFRFERQDIIEIPREEIMVKPKEVKFVRESMEINQGKLTMGFRTNISYDDPTYPALMVYVNLLGGGAHSKLFLKVREERSLCYYIYSRMEKFKSIMLVSCGIEFTKYEETVEVIKQQLEEIKKGNITDEELENTKKAMINSVKEMGDNVNSIADFYYGQVITNQYITPKELIKSIEAVKKEDVAAVGEKILLDTIYFLENGQQ